MVTNLSLLTKVRSSKLGIKKAAQFERLRIVTRIAIIDRNQRFVLCLSLHQLLQPELAKQN